MSKLEAIVFIILQIFCNACEKCLRTAYCMQRGMFSFECFLERLMNKKDFPSSVATTKPFLILN